MHVDNSDESGKTCTYDVDDQTVRSVYVQAGNTIEHVSGILQILGSQKSDTVELFLGEQANGSGTYKLTGGKLVVHNSHEEGEGEVIVGNYTPADFEQSGANSVCEFDTLYIGCYTYPEEEWSAYKLTSGKLTVLHEEIGRVGGAEVIQTGGVHHAGQIWMGYWPSSEGWYTLSGDGDLWVESGLEIAGDGWGRFTQEGTSTVDVGFLSLACHYGGEYRLASSTGTEVVELTAACITIGDVDTGTFEWFSGRIDTSLMAFGAPTSSEPPRSPGTLVMGCDFDAGDLASGAIFENDVYPDAEVTGLDEATLEITNGATATHEGGAPLVEVGRLNIGDSHDPGGGAGTYSFVGTGFSATEAALQADIIFVGYDFAYEEATGGTLNVGDGEVASTPLIVVTVSLHFGTQSTFTVEEGCTCGISLTYPGAILVFLVHDDGSGNENMAGLSSLTLAFRGEHPWNVMEVAGARAGNDPELSGFSTDNFLIDKLVVGENRPEEPFYGPVRLDLLDGVDNRDDGDDDEALYVNSIVMEGGGTFLRPDKTEIADYIYFKHKEGQVETAERLYAGDANLDGQVDGGDYSLWADHYGMTGGATWNEADFNGDRCVNGADYTIWSDNYGSGRGEGKAGGDPDKVTELIARSKDGDFDGDGDIDGDDVKVLLSLEK